MKKTNLLLAAVMALTMTSCQEVPEDVKSRADEKEQQMSAAAEDSKAAKEDDDFDPYVKVSFEEAKKELEGYKFKQHDNLNFVCSPTPIKADAIYNIDTTWGYGETAGEEDLEKTREVLKSFWHQDDVSDDQMKVAGGNLTQIILTGTKDGVALAETGRNLTAFAFYDFGEGDYYWSIVDLGLANFKLDNYPTEKVELPYEDDIPTKEKLKMVDGSELSIEEAIQQAEGYIEQLRELDMFDEGETQRLYRGAIGTYKDMGKIMCLHYQQVRHGIPMDDGGKYIAWPTRTPFFEIWFYGSEHLAKVYNWHGGIEKDKEEIAEIIPLSSAEHLAADKLAPGLSFNVSEAELRYLCFSDPDNYEEIMRFQPMWCFTAAESDSSTSGSMKFERIMIYVDAVTGDVYYSNAPSREFHKSPAPKRDQ